MILTFLMLLLVEVTYITVAILVTLAVMLCMALFIIFVLRFWKIIFIVLAGLWLFDIVSRIP